MQTCPKCSNKYFRVSFVQTDTVVYRCTVDDDESVEFIDFLKDYPGDSDIDDMEDIECDECGHVLIEGKTDEEVRDEDN